MADQAELHRLFVNLVGLATQTRVLTEVRSWLLVTEVTSDAYDVDPDLLYGHWEDADDTISGMANEYVEWQMQPEPYEIPAPEWCGQG